MRSRGKCFKCWGKKPNKHKTNPIAPKPQHSEHFKPHDENLREGYTHLPSKERLSKNKHMDTKLRVRLCLSSPPSWDEKTSHDDCDLRENTKLSPQNHFGETERRPRRDGSRPSLTSARPPIQGSQGTFASRASLPRLGVRSDGRRPRPRSGCERPSPGGICAETPRGCRPLLLCFRRDAKRTSEKTTCRLKWKGKKNADELSEAEGGDLRRVGAAEASRQREMRRGSGAGRAPSILYRTPGTALILPSLPSPAPADPRSPGTPLGCGRVLLADQNHIPQFPPKARAERGSSRGRWGNPCVFWKERVLSQESVSQTPEIGIPSTLRATFPFRF